MLCQNCNQNEATTHIKRVVNGEAEEHHLCAECAKKLGYDHFLDDFSLSIPNFFSSFFHDTMPALKGAGAAHCETCGSSFEDIVRSGMVGCADCYDKFFDRLLPSIQRIHGRARHAGKTPHYTVVPDEKGEQAPPEKTQTAEQQIAALQQEMQKAIDSQNFEQAAVLRDKIKELKGDAEK